MKTKYFFTISVVLLSFLLTGFSGNLEVIVVTETWEPYNFEKNGKVTGISTEIIEQSLNKAGIKISENRILLCPWVRAYKMASEKENVLIYTILRTSEREKLFKWIGPLVPSEKFYFYKLSMRKDIVINSLEDAKKYQIGVLKSSVHDEFLLSHGFSKTAIQPVANQESNIKKLLLKRVDIIIDTESSLGIRTKQLNLTFSKFEKSLFLFEEGYFMAFSKKTSNEIADKVMNAFTELRKEGMIDKIIRKYKRNDE